MRYLVTCQVCGGVSAVVHVVVKLCMLHEHQLGYVVKFDQVDDKFCHCLGLYVEQLVV